jgi:hypothetical protein
VQISEYGFSTYQGPYDSGPSLSWAVVLKNPNPADTSIADRVDVSVTLLDAGGGVVASAQDTVAAILPGQTVAVTGSDSAYGNPDLGLIKTMEVQIGSPQWEDAGQTLGTFQISSIATRTGEFGQLTTTARVKSTFAKELKSTMAVAVYRNAAGKIVGGDFTFVDFIPAGGTASLSISGLSAIPGIDHADVYLSLSFLSITP